MRLPFVIALSRLTRICFLLLLFAGTSCCFDCGCEDCDKPQPQPPRLDNFILKHQPKVQSYGGGRTHLPFHIGGQQGTQFDMPANSWTRMNDNLPFSGNLEAGILEIQDKKSLVLMGQSTVGPDGLLPTLGIACITVWQHTVRSPLLDAPLTILFPAGPQATASAQVYNVPQNYYMPSYYSGLPENWSPLPGPVPGSVASAPLINTGSNWWFRAEGHLKQSASWCVVEPWPAGTVYAPFDSATWTMPVPQSSFEYSNRPLFYLLSDNRLSMAELTPHYDSTRKSGTLHTNIPLPQGQPAHLIGMHREEGVLYYGKTAFTIGQPAVPHLELKKITEDSLLIELNAL